MELKKIIKSASYLVFSKIIQFIFGVIRSKFAAVFIGTTGVGIFNQVSYLTNMISDLTLLSMNDGLVKQIAQNKDKVGFKDKLKGLIKSYSILIIIAVSISFIICLVFSKYLTIFFLGDYAYLTYYLYGITCVPILIINSLSFALLKSYKATREISQANIFSSVIALCFFVPLVYFFKTTGAVVSVCINFVIIFYINNYHARKLIISKIGFKFKELFTARIENKYIKELLYFAFFGVTSGLIFIVSESICRSIVVNRLGIDKLGIYSPIISWSGLLTGFVLPSVQVYLYPRYSECKSNQEISGIFNDFLYLVSFLMIPFMFLAIPLRNLLIPLFYTNEFIEASKYLPWHFIGVSFYMWWYVLALVLTPTGRIKIHSILVSLMSFLNIAIVCFLVPKIGLYGWMLKFIISPFLFIFIYYFYLNKKTDLTISRKNLLIMIYTVVISILLIAIDNYKIKYPLSLVFIGSSILFLSKSEKHVIIKKFQEIKFIN